jgi:hypothetical protein
VHGTGSKLPFKEIVSLLLRAEEKFVPQWGVESSEVRDEVMWICLCSWALVNVTGVRPDGLK